jgi:hypothetical protein
MTDRAKHAGVLFWLPVLLALALALPSLGVGLLFDDHLHALSATADESGRPPVLFDLYDFTPEWGTDGQWRGLPHPQWWTSPEFSLRFFRPLSSLLLALDLRSFGDRLWIAHLHSILWYLALVAVVTTIHRRMVGMRSALLASVVYAVAVGHLSPSVWLSARHASISATLGLLGLAMHMRYRESGGVGSGTRLHLFRVQSEGHMFRILAPIPIGLAMLSGELSLAALALLFAYELFGRCDTMVRRVAALAPYMALFAAYCVEYVWGGYGASGTGLYIVPWKEPTQFLHAAVERIPILLAELISGAPASAIAVQPEHHGSWAIWGLAITVLTTSMLVGLRRRLEPRERRALGWLVPGALVSLLPAAAGILGGRALLPALVASSLLVALLLRHGVAAARDAATPIFGRAVLWAGVVWLVFAHIVWSPAYRVGVTLLWGNMSRETSRIAEAVPDCGPRFVVPAASDPLLSAYIPLLLMRERPVERYRVLSAARADHRIEAVTPTGFDLVVVGDRVLNYWERVHTDVVPRAGDVVELPDMRIEVVEAVDAGPVRLRVDFGRPLDEDPVCLLAWSNGDLTRVEPLVPGDSLDLKLEPGPMGL